MIYDITQAAMERDKRKFVAELRDYFVDKTRQESGWAIVNAISHRLRHKTFTHGEALRIAHYLKEKFEIRSAHLEYARSFREGGVAVKVQPNPSPDITDRQSVHEFHSLFLRLQVSVQEQLLSHRDACRLIQEIQSGYPST
ncbi:hypothetical protein [Desulfogranum japonicum]|uniref:hypothetical protein n=1 Tax=Desulfogranum japonicum TaxID=231447 RepID=UPI00041E9FF5|nr:hypothetical protein [Desulfogranum japonicum]